MTAPAHPVVFRPIIRLLRDAGHEVEVTARDYAQTIPLLKRMGMEHTAVGRHGGASRARKAQALVEPHVEDAPLRRQGPLRPRGRPRLQRPRARRRQPPHPGGQHVRLRVRRPAAQHRLPARPPRDDARRDPAGAARALRRRPGQARPVRRAQGGVLPLGLHARPGRARPPRRRPRPRGGDRPAAAGRLALPPQVQPPVPARARLPRAPRGRLGRRHPAHGGAAPARR